MKLTITFKREDLHILAPAGSTVEETWVVCIAHRPTVKVSGMEALGSVDAWQPMLPVASEAAAVEKAEEFARATCEGEPTRLTWVDVFDDQGNPTGGQELFIALGGAGLDDDEDAGSEQADIAIVPLSMLAEGSAR